MGDGYGKQPGYSNESKDGGNGIRTVIREVLTSARSLISLPDYQTRYLVTLNPMQHCTVKPCLEIPICRKGGDQARERLRDGAI